MNKVGKIVLYIILMSVLVGAVGVILYFTVGGEPDTDTNTGFGVEVDGRVCLDKTVITLKEGETKFEVGQAYTVKVVPNVTDETDFVYTVDGESKRFSEIADATSGLDMTPSETGFTVYNDGISVRNILKKLYGTNKVELEIADKKTVKPYFGLVIASTDGQHTLTLYLEMSADGIFGFSIKLDKDGIVL